MPRDVVLGAIDPGIYEVALPDSAAEMERYLERALDKFALRTNRPVKVIAMPKGTPDAKMWLVRQLGMRWRVEVVERHGIKLARLEG